MLNFNLVLSSFFLFSSSFPSCITLEVYSVYKWSMHQTNALLSEIFFLAFSCMRAKIDELWPQAHIVVGFPIRHFVHNFMHNFKTKGCIRTFYLGTIALLLEICTCILLVTCMADTIGELWIQTRIATTSNRTFRVYLYLHAQHENCRLYVDVLLFKWLLYYWRCLFSLLDLDVRYEWRVTPLNTYCSLFPISHFCIYSTLRLITWKL